MSSFWSGWIILLTVANIIGAVWLLWMTSRLSPEEKASETTGHVWDGDLKEYNNPLPRWWLWLFYLTVVFSIIYLVLFPGLGNFQGVLGWSQTGQYQEEVARIEARQDEFFARFAEMDIAELARDPDAMSAAANIFGNRCAQCHGSDGRGAPGFPNLTDQAWLWGGDETAVLASIQSGRVGVMPPMADSLGGEQGVAQMVEYVRSLSGLDHDADMAAAAAPLWPVCGACHGMDGTGMTALGSPNLTDANWLYGSGRATIAETITGGRQNNMPAQLPVLGELQSRVLAAYVLRLSGQLGD
ncbi:cytochrome-c oxidase, cbb3-type subunit III [Thioalkalivibrio sp. XN279]|uniref:cytochrome-c oxidase, cbb3-type subunit III n=1 Tax=Thioalkalivibrio sp. XN279 TaxID=2714953 RepID=UPI001407D27B|nr:cytochrome-c oxidase, cbb3-type subunit III [Thioalkalivibrio sp. XN279]NHA14955.1 cytochrome-c oxidase, cbb3-type subunit III [Thioalkalivibrio sp. XN279]